MKPRPWEEKTRSKIVVNGLVSVEKSVGVAFTGKGADGFRHAILEPVLDGTRAKEEKVSLDELGCLVDSLAAVHQRRTGFLVNLLIANMKIKKRRVVWVRTIENL
jgi:hypothetical protein